MSLEKHAKDYKPEAWKQYTPVELYWWVKLLCKRAGQRDNPEKKAKDLYDAGNYLNMLRETASEDAKAVSLFLEAEHLYLAEKAKLA